MSINRFWHPACRQSSRNTSGSAARAVIFAGQSNAQNLYTYGALPYKAVLDTYWAGTVNSVLDGATSGSALLKAHVSDTNWWYDDVALTYGAAWDSFAAAVSAYSGSIQAIHWDQGESDQGAIANSPSEQTRYKDALITVFTAMRALVGQVPVFICPIGRRGDSSTGTGYHVLREIQQQLAVDYGWIHLLPEKFTEGDDGGAHLDVPTGYENYAPKAARKLVSVLGSGIAGVDGPSIASASRMGKTITVTMAHDNGNDVTPTTAIEGFKFFDDSTEISISAATRKDADNINLTLAAIPTSAAQRLYYAYDRLTGVDHTKLVRDNSSNAMPLRASKITSIPRIETYMDDIVAGAVFQHDARLFNYAGEQDIKNLISYPHDGQSQSTYDGVLGSSWSVGTNDPGYSSGRWTFDGGDYLRAGGTSPTAFQAALSTTQSFTFLMHFKTPSSWSGNVILFSCGGNSSTIPGFLLRYMIDNNCLRLGTATGSATNIYNLSTATQLATNTVYKLAVSYNPTTGAFTAWINSSTPAQTGTASGLAGGTSTAPFNVCNTCPAGTELYGYAIYDSVLNNTQINSLFGYYDTL